MELPAFATEYDSVLHHCSSPSCDAIATFLLPDTTYHRIGYACEAHLVDLTLRRAGIARLDYLKGAKAAQR